jgi:hypothetical protein
MEKCKWYEYEPNVTSALRIGFMIGIISGALGLLTSLVFFLMIFFTGKWEASPMVVTLITVSGGIMAMSDIAKGIQSHAEERSNK